MNFLDNYSNMTFLERREALCRWLIGRARFGISWHLIQNKIARACARKDKYANYESELHFYTGIDDAGKDVFNGLNFNKDWCMRDILIQDLVLEVESADADFNLQGTIEICNNLQKEGIGFFVFDHQGKSFHIHIYDIFPGVGNWAEKEMLAAMFAMKVVPAKYFALLDMALFGQHQIALEFAKHYKTDKMNKPLFYYLPGREQCIL